MNELVAGAGGRLPLTLHFERFGQKGWRLAPFIKHEPAERPTERFGRVASRPYRVIVLECRPSFRTFHPSVSARPPFRFSSRPGEGERLFKIEGINFFNKPRERKKIRPNLVGIEIDFSFLFPFFSNG